ncbi:unnamed protein product, partial [Prorocentrum cordatum]
MADPPMEARPSLPMEPRPSVPMEPRPSLPMEPRQSLLTRNREIAQIREELKVCGLEVTSEQAKNHALLEESSQLDSEIFGHDKRAGAAEARLAEVHYGNERWEAELARQQQAHAAIMLRLNSELATQRATEERAEAEAAAERERCSEASGEVERLRGRLASETAALARVQSDREQRSFEGAVSSGAAAAAEQLLSEELGAASRWAEARRAETDEARRSLAQVEADLAAQLGERAALRRSLGEA